MLNKKALSATAGAPKVFVEDVFSCFLYTGNGSTQTITNNIDLSGEGGLVWIKSRNWDYSHYLSDTARGVDNQLRTNTTNGVDTTANRLTAFNSSGFTLGNDATHNSSLYNYASWTFRKAEKFFDVVTFTTNASGGATVSHALGSTPGCVIIKSTGISQNWFVYHRGLTTPNDYMINLNTTAAEQNQGAAVWSASSSAFTINNGTLSNSTAYVAYLFAHDAGGFGDAGDQSVISCGSLTTNSSGFGSVNLGWEPQWVLIKESNGIFDWNLFDSMRGMSGVPYNTASDAFIEPNTSDAESTGSRIGVSATGFEISLNNSKNYIYIAIRRGPMKTPETGTSVFNPVVYTGTAVDNRLINTTIAPDMAMIRRRDSSGIDGMYVGTRLLSNQYLLTGTTDAAASDADSFMTPTSGVGNAFSAMNGVGVGVDATRQFNANTTSNNHVIHAFKRSPGFFDVVCYTGTGANRTVTHNLGVVPELMILKSRTASAAFPWTVYVSSIGTDGYVILDSSDAATTGVGSSLWNSTAPTSLVFSLGTANQININTDNFVAYLFASLSGVSKVGSYTGNGSSVTVTTNFQPRFILVKRTDSTGDWIVSDSARGLVAGDDPYLELNTTDAEVTNEDWVDISSTSFTVNQTTNNANVNTGTYIYLAIA